MITVPLIFFYYELLIVINMIIYCLNVKRLNKHHSEAVYNVFMSNIWKISDLVTGIGGENLFGKACARYQSICMVKSKIKRRRNMTTMVNSYRMLHAIRISDPEGMP